VKFGTDNSKKTVAAGALFLVAIVMFIHMISGSTGSSAPTSTTTAVAPPPPATRPARRVAGRRGSRGSVEKTSGPVTPSLDPRLRLAQLKETEETNYDGKGRNIFMSTEEPLAKIPEPQGTGFKQPDKQPVAVVIPTPNVPPPINLKFFGFASGPDHKRVFLAQGDDVFVAGEGEIVQRRYKIVKINANNIEVLDVLSNNRQTIPLTAG